MQYGHPFYRINPVLTWSVPVDFVRRSRHVHVFGPTPEALVQIEIAHLSVKLVVANVTLDEVLRSPTNRAQCVFPFVCDRKYLK